MKKDVIAYFVTHHGFGHASRAAAVMAAMQVLLPGIRFEIFSACPSWIFQESIPGAFAYHRVPTDVGLVQASLFEENLPATCEILARWLPFDPVHVNALADQLLKMECRLVACDISPLGIAVAQRAGLPSVLVESFTWDWIYRQMAGQAPGLDRFAGMLETIYRQVDLRIQTEPLCSRLEQAALVNPIYRWPLTDPRITRNRLEIPPASKMVLVTMGGVPDRFECLDRLPSDVDPFLIIAGGDDRRSAHPKVKLLPTFSDFYHPDLIQAADVIIGKAGYSTIAEACYAGVPFGYILRPRFPESAHLARFIMQHMPGRSISAAAHLNGRWIESLPDLFALAPKPSPFENGAFQTARLMLEELK